MPGAVWSRARHGVNAVRVGRHAVKRSVAPFLVAASVWAAGCGAPAPVRRDVSSAARRFGEALNAGHGAAACEHLAPDTSQELEQERQAPCAEAILQAGVRGAASVRHTSVYGQQAMLRLGTDTVFLSRFPSGWKVTAAGCERRSGEPYQCQLKDG